MEIDNKKKTLSDLSTKVEPSVQIIFGEHPKEPRVNYFSTPFDLVKLADDINDCSVRYAKNLHAVPDFIKLEKMIPVNPIRTKNSDIFDENIAAGWHMFYIKALMNAEIELAQQPHADN